jgi:hypothetical protein
MGDVSSADSRFEHDAAHAGLGKAEFWGCENGGVDAKAPLGGFQACGHVPIGDRYEAAITTL